MYKKIFSYCASPRVLWALVLMSALSGCARQVNSSYLATVDIFGATKHTCLELVDSKGSISYEVDDSDAHFRRFLVQAQGDKQTLRVVDESIEQIGAFKEHKSFVIQPSYAHVYLQKEIPATHYMQGNKESGGVKFVTIKNSGTGVNFYYSTQTIDTEEPFGNAIADVALSANFTPLGASSEGLYEIHLQLEDPIWGEFSFAVRHDMGEGFNNQGRSHSWATVYLENDDLSGTAAVIAPKLAKYTMPAAPAAVDLGSGAYSYTVDVFNFDENNLPKLYQVVGKDLAPLVSHNTLNRQNGYYRMYFRSDDDVISIMVKNGEKPSKLGAFTNGSLVLTKDYAHAYLVGDLENDQTSASINRPNPAITYYASANATGQVTLTAIKNNAKSLTLFYTSPSTQTSFEANETNSNSGSQLLSEADLLLPQGQRSAGMHRVWVEPALMIAPDSQVAFKVRTALNPQELPTTLFGMHPQDDIVVAVKHAHFTMPAYGHQVVGPKTSWHYRPLARTDNRMALLATAEKDSLWQQGGASFGFHPSNTVRSWQNLETVLLITDQEVLFRYDFTLEDGDRFQSAFLSLFSYGTTRIYLNNLDITDYQNSIKQGLVRPVADDVIQWRRFINLPPQLLKTGQNNLIISLNPDEERNALLLDVENFTLFEQPYDLEPTVLLNVNMHVGKSSDQRGFSWSSNSERAQALHYWQEEATAKTAIASSKAMEKLHGYRSHQVSIAGLAPASTYFYQIHEQTSGGWQPLGEVYRFSTALGEEGFSFIAVTDTQIGKNGLVEPVARAWYNSLDNIAQSWSGASFILSSGDQIEHADQQYQYNLYFAHPLLKSMPLAVTSGTHDKHAIYLEHFNLPAPLTPIGGSPTGGNYWFSYGPVLFISLDTTDRSPADTQKHIEFMQQSIAAYRAQNGGEDPLWRIVNFHYLPYATTRYAIHPVLRALRANISPALSALDIDVVFNGHDHAYGRTLMLEGGYNANQGDLEDGTVGARAIHDGYLRQGDNPYAEFTKQAGQFFHHTGNTISRGFNPLYPTDYAYHAYTQQNNRPTVTHVEVSEDALIFKAYYSDHPISEETLFDSFVLRRNR